MAFVMLLPSIGLAGHKQKNTNDGKTRTGVKEGILWAPSSEVVELKALSHSEREKLFSLLLQNRFIGDDEHCIPVTLKVEEKILCRYLPLSILTVCVRQNRPVKLQFEGAMWSFLVDRTGSSSVAMYQNLRHPVPTRAEATLDERRQRATALLDMIN